MLYRLHLRFKVRQIYLPFQGNSFRTNQPSSLTMSILRAIKTLTQLI